MDHEAVYPKDLPYKMVGDYHTHPCFPYTHYPTSFSPNDVVLYEYYDIQGYMANGCDANIMHWSPTDPDMLLELDGKGPFGVDYNTVYDGDIVGKISLNKIPDIQESVMDGLKYFFKPAPKK